MTVRICFILIPLNGVLFAKMYALLYVSVMYRDRSSTEQISGLI